MADPTDEPVPLPDASPSREESGVAITGIETAVVDAIEAGDSDRVKELIEPLHAADVADHLQRLSSDQRLAVLDVIRDELHPEVLSELDTQVREEIIEHLGVEEVAEAVAELDTDDAVDLIEELDEADQREILDAIPAEERSLIEEALAFPEDSAGRLMQPELVSVPATWTVGQTIDFVGDCAEEESCTLPEEFYDVFVVDDHHRPVGSIPVGRLLQRRRSTPVARVMDPASTTITATLDQEEVAFLFRQRDLVSAPVVDGEGRLLGVITVDDVVDVIDEEQEEDIMLLGGVPEHDLYQSVADTARSRFSWLLVNLVTAVLASFAIGMFEAALEKVVALAILMPIVASMGGNAGTQALTVAVRALATKELTPTNALRVVFKELLVGSANGAVLAVVTGGVAWAWFGDGTIGLVIGVAMVVNLAAAGLAGAAIPLVLERFRIDPAVASSVFVTTVTDVVGFCAFLGLASLALL